MKEIVVAWKEISSPIESPSIPFDKDEYEDEAAIEVEMNAIQFELKDGHRKVLIHLNDTDSTLESITALVSTLNDMRVFYSRP